MLSKKTKQINIKNFIKTIRPDIKVQFNNTKRAKYLFGKAKVRSKIIVFYNPLFKYNLDSCLDCVLHEVAHIFHYEITGQIGHNKDFKDIYYMLLDDYGNKEIKAANKRKAGCFSDYT